jgi:hypothetical protein
MGIGRRMACAMLSRLRVTMTPLPLQSSIANPPRRVKLLLRCLMFVAALSCTRHGTAHAQMFKPTEHAFDPDYRPENGYWAEGAPRWFVSTKSEIGAPYTKPYFSFGYGLPHWIWTGIDVNAILTTSVLEVYGGARIISTPEFDVAFGARDNWSFDKPFLNPKSSYTSDDVFKQPGKLAHYSALEAEAVAVLPLPYSALAFDFVMVDVLNKPSDQYLYEESYRLITKDPVFFVLRGAALARFLHEQCFKVGVLAEWGFSTGRGSDVLRVGPIMMLQVTDHLALNMGFTVKAASPDHLGLTLGAYGIAGLRYTWATGERRPSFPWKEEVIPFGRRL